VIRMLKMEGVAPTVRTFNAFLKAHIDNRHYHQIPRVLEAMKDEGIEWDLETYNLLIEAQAKTGDVGMALATLQEVENGRAPTTKLNGNSNENSATAVQPDLTTYANVLLAFKNKVLGTFDIATPQQLLQVIEAEQHAQMQAKNTQTQENNNNNNNGNNNNNDNNKSSTNSNNEDAEEELEDVEDKEEAEKLVKEAVVTEDEMALMETACQLFEKAKAKFKAIEDARVNEISDENPSQSQSQSQSHTSSSFEKEKGLIWEKEVEKMNSMFESVVLLCEKLEAFTKLDEFYNEMKRMRIRPTLPVIESVGRASAKQLAREGRKITTKIPSPAYKW